MRAVRLRRAGAAGAVRASVRRHAAACACVPRQALPRRALPCLAVQDSRYRCARRLADGSSSGADALALCCNFCCCCCRSSLGALAADAAAAKPSAAPAVCDLLLVAARSIVRCFAVWWCSICVKMRWQLGGPAVRCVSRSDTQRSPVVPMPMVAPCCRDGWLPYLRGLPGRSRWLAVTRWPC